MTQAATNIAGLKLVDLLSKRFVSEITCDKPQRDYFEVGNLLGEDTKGNDEFDQFSITK